MFWGGGRVRRSQSLDPWWEALSRSMGWGSGSLVEGGAPVCCLLDKNICVSGCLMGLGGGSVCKCGGVFVVCVGNIFFFF